MSESKEEEIRLGPLSQIDDKDVIESEKVNEEVEESEDVRLSTSRIVVLAAGMMMTFFIGTASTASVILLIPSMARDLESTELSTQWISSAYTLAFACGLLFSGRLGDILGRRRMYLSGLVIYVVFAILTGAVKNRIAMCIFRACSGLGMSIVMPAGFGIIGVNIKHEPARTRVFTTFGLGNPIGAATGSLIGGAMASIGPNGWQYLFYLLSAVAAILGLLAYFIIPPDKPNPAADKRIDWIGGLLITAALCLFTFSMTESGHAANGWKSPHVPALLVTSFILLGLFISWSLYLERRTTRLPVIKMSLFSRRPRLIGVVCICAMGVTTSVSSWIYTTTIFYQKYKGESPIQNSISILTTTIMGVVVGLIVMIVAPRFRASYILPFTILLTAGTSLMYANWPEGTSFWAYEFPAQLLIPWGADFMTGLGNAMTSNLVKQDEQSVGGALFQTSAQIGLALGICIASLINSQVEQMTGDVLKGCRAAFWFGSAMGLTVATLSAIGLRRVRLAKDIGKLT